MFQPGAAARYGYKPRREGWKKYKQRRWKSGETPLVASGLSKFRIMRQGRVQIGGAAEGGKKKLEGRLIMRFDWAGDIAQQQKEKHERLALEKRLGVRGGRGPRYQSQRKKFYLPAPGVTAQDMKREVAKVIRSESQTLAKVFKEAGFRKIKEFRGSRKRVRMPTK